MGAANTLTLLLALVAGAACSFSGDVSLTPADASPLSDAGADAGPPVCDRGDNDLVLCMRFEHQNGATTLLDESQYGNHASVSNASFANGTDMQALVTGSDFESRIDESPSLDVTREITMEMWIKPVAPALGQQWLFDNDQQWGVYLDVNKTFGCNLGPDGILASQNNVILAGAWQHVACVYDGATMRLYLNGKSAAAADFSKDLLTVGVEGSCLALDCPGAGLAYVGQMDTLRVWSKAQDQQALCDSANLPDDQCPDERLSSF